MKTPTIKTKDFILRPYRKGDRKSLQNNINNKKIYERVSNIPYPYTMKDARDWIKKKLKEERQKKRTSMAFAIDIGREVVGSIGLASMITGHKAEVGYWLAEKYWNKGIMTKAVKLITKFGFSKLKLKRMAIRVLLFNKASRRVAEKAGYKFEGILRKDIKKGNKFLDDYLFAKVK